MAAAKKPVIKKLGTIECDLVEATPVVFKGRLYRFEWVRGQEYYKPNTTGNAYFRFIDLATGEPTPGFAAGYALGSAHAQGDTMYAFGANEWDGERIQAFCSKDLESWSQKCALEIPGWGFLNNSVCKGDKKFVMAIEVGKPPEVVGVHYAMRFAQSDDLFNWKLLGEEAVYSKDRYTACPALRFFDGFYYMIYLEGFNLHAWPDVTKYRLEPYIVRSKDLIQWESSPFNPVLEISDDDRIIDNANFTEEQKKRIATAVNVNNSDVDLCEFEGRTIIYYSWGDQHGVEHLAHAVYEGTLKDFMEGFFPG